MITRRLGKTGALIDYALAKVRDKLGRQHPPGTTAFKDRHRELQELAREVFVLRNHNLQFKEGEPQDQLLMFAEGAMILVCMERFFRAMLGSDATNADTLHNLLEKAFSEKRYDHLEVPGGNREHLIELVTGLRNGLLHGDFEQLAQKAGCASNREYFKRDYPRDLEKLYNILNNMMGQIDIATGKVHEIQLRARWQTRLVDALSHRASWRAKIDAARAGARRK
jgi:hypothetical protein